MTVSHGRKVFGRAGWQAAMTPVEGAHIPLVAEIEWGPDTGINFPYIRGEILHSLAPLFEVTRSSMFGPCGRIRRISWHNPLEAAHSQRKPE